MSDIEIRIKAAVDKAAKDLDTIAKKISGVGDASKKTQTGGIKALTDGFALLKGAVLPVVGALAGLAAGLKFAVSQASEAQQIQAQLNQTLESTEYAAGLTADEIGHMADQLSQLSGVEDDAIAKAGAVMLTFTNIGEETFPGAMEAALNLSVALGQDLQSSVIQVGKALNDPNGMAAMKRIGVSFSDAQIEMGKQLFATGKKVEYQQLILEELNKEFGGQAAKNILTYAGSVDQVKNAVGNLAEAIGDEGLPELTLFNLGVAEGINALREWLLLKALSREVNSFTGTLRATNRELWTTDDAAGQVSNRLLALYAEQLVNADQAALYADINEDLAGDLAGVADVAVQQGLALKGLGEQTEDTAGQSERLNAIAEQQIETQGRLVTAIGNVQEAEENWMEGSGKDVAGALDAAGLKSERYAAALGAIDAVYGTDLTTQQQYKTDVQDLVKEYQKTGDLDAFKTKLGELKDTYMPLNEEIIKAKNELHNVRMELEHLKNQRADVYVVTHHIDVYGDEDFDTPPTPGDPNNPHWRGVEDDDGPTGTQAQFESTKGGGESMQGFAAGGPVTAGEPVLVGEEGPEIFQPNSSGQIIPHDKIGGVTVNVYANVSEKIDAEEWAYTIADIIERRRGG